jgi:hypothetical protein
MRLHFRQACTATLLAVAVMAPPLAAQPEGARATARDLANLAADAVAAGQHARADQLLAQAYDVYPAPTIALLHARTLVKLGKLTQALRAYERAATTQVAKEDPAPFQSAIDDARRELSELRPRVPRLQVVVAGTASATRSSLQLFIDGERVPQNQWGQWQLVDPGLRTLRVEREGSVKQRTARLHEGQSLVVELTAPEPRGAERWLTVGALGVGAVGLGVGVVGGLMAGSAREDAYEACAGGRCVEGTDGARHLKSFRRQRTISTVGYAVAAGGLGLGGFLLLRGSFDENLALDIDVASATSAGVL